MYLLLHEIHCFVCMSIYVLSYFIGPGWSFAVSDRLQKSAGPIKTGPGWFGSVFDAKEKI